ncbi:hypothetical protein [Sulfobacillus thermosulfidooxidans]|nr:hypothetical protein [Sulfobacillus thermosulfidooxidans]
MPKSVAGLTILLGCGHSTSLGLFSLSLVTPEVGGGHGLLVTSGMA